MALLRLIAHVQLGLALASTLVGCSVAKKPSGPAITPISHSAVSQPDVERNTKFFLVPDSPRETIDLMIEGIKSENFSQIQDMVVAALADAHNPPLDEQKVFTHLIYEFGKCDNSLRPAGPTLGIFQCPSGKSWRRYSANGEPVGSDSRYLNISAQDRELFQYRVKNLLPIVARYGFTIVDGTENLGRRGPSHLRSPIVEILAEKPNQIALMNYNIDATGAPLEALVLSFDMYVIEE